MLNKRIITLTGASGSGKTTIVKYLLNEITNSKLIVSLTTRKPRTSDLPGEYKYVTQREFDDLRREGKFIWTVNIHGNFYGTLFQSIDESLSASFYSFMILVPKATCQLLRYAPYHLMPFYVISPPPEILRERLRERGENKTVIDKRIDDCRLWDMEARTSGIPYKFIQNDGLIKETCENALFLIRRNGL